MENIKTSFELNEAILILEMELSMKEEALKEQFILFYNHLKPTNLIINTLKEIATSPQLIDNTVGMVTGYISEKLVTGKSDNNLRSLLGALLGAGVTNIVANHSETIKTFGQFIIKSIFCKKENNTTIS